MNEKEIGELRRRYKQDKNNIGHIRGCYVNEKREIVSTFDQTLALMPQDQAEKILSILKKTLSGTLGRNLIDITFETQQVVDSDEYRLLTALRESGLKDENANMAFFEKVISSLEIEGNYMILLSQDTYDVPYRSRDDFSQQDASSEVFSYILCSVCPLKMTKEALSYYVYENSFHTLPPDWVIAPPELGFMFPAFDDRSTNLYNALYYTKNTAESHKEFVDAVFNAEIPMPAAAQKEAFGAILGETLVEECSFEVVQAVHEQLCGLIEEHKVTKEEDPLLISKGTVHHILENCGVEESRVEAFETKFDQEFGEGASISPKNLVDAKQFQVVTPDVTIKVNPERGDLVETRVIDGVQYVLIRADSGVEVNGVPIHIS